jgi:exosome complex component RRP41
MQSVAVEYGVLQGAVAGSSIVAISGSRVVCAVKGPSQLVGEYRANEGRVVCHVGRAPFAYSTRKDAQAGASENASDASFSASLTGALERAVLLESFPQLQYDIVLDIVAADGFEHVACVLAASIAIAECGVEMKDMLGAAMGVVDRAGNFIDVSPETADDAGDNDAGAILVIGTVHGQEVCSVDFAGDVSGEVLGKAISGALAIIAQQRVVLTDALFRKR